MAENENTITLDELRRRQLARLKGETPSGATTESLSDDSLDAAYQRACAEAENGGWEIPDRLSWQTEHEAWLEKQRNRKQPESTEPENFVVGANRDRYGDRTAIPSPRWPEPGALMTREVVRTYDAELDLCRKAARALTDVIWWTRTRLNEPEFWEATDRNAGLQSRYAETWAWLMGIWQGRKIQPPTETQVETWAREWDRDKKVSGGLTKAVHTESDDESS